MIFLSAIGEATADVNPKKWRGNRKNNDPEKEVFGSFLCSGVMTCLAVDAELVGMVMMGLVSSI